MAMQCFVVVLIAKNWDYCMLWSQNVNWGLQLLAIDL